VNPFRLVRPRSLADAHAVLGADPRGTTIRAGGVDLMDRWKEGIDRPATVLDLRTAAAAEDARALASLSATATSLAVGALVTLDALAETPLPAAFAAVRAAAGQAANPAIRRQATAGGNLLQRPRCWYFRHPDLACLKKGGSRCLAAEGNNRYNAVLGGGPSYIVHPSSLATALVAFDGHAVVQASPGRPKEIPLGEFFVGPTERLDAETVLRPGEILLGVRVSAPAGARSAYDAVRERRLYDWPLVEAAVRLRVEAATLRDVRVVLGQVAPIPWRAREAEAVLEGRRPTPERLAEAARAAFEGARPLSDNHGKIAVGRGLVRRLLHQVTGVPLPA